MDKDRMNADVFEHGTSIGTFDMSKAEAEALCKQRTEETGLVHDWHYSGGRVHVMYLPKEFYELKYLRWFYEKSQNFLGSSRGDGVMQALKEQYLQEVRLPIPARY